MKFSDHVRNLEDIARRLESTSVESERGKEALAIMAELLRDVAVNVRDYDELSKTTIALLGDRAQSLLENFARYSKSDLDFLFIFLVRCAREKQLRELPTIRNGPVDRALNYYWKDASRLINNEKMEADFLREAMPALIQRELFDGITRLDREIAKKHEEWATKIETSEQRLRQSEALVEKYRTQFNFVGLANAFQKLASEKAKEKGRIFTLLVLLAVAVVAPAAIQWLSGAETIFSMSSDGSLLGIKFGKLIPLVILELVILYYFRITLQNYVSAKAQLLQLELRYSLCAFVEAYADFAREKGQSANGQSILTRFEALIFSGIVLDSSKIPSTLDGVDQLARLIAEVRKEPR